MNGIAQAKKFEKNRMLDQPMNKVYSWSKSNLAVRTALWNHFMDKNDLDTIKTSEAFKPWLDMSDDDVKDKAGKILRK